MELVGMVYLQRIRNMKRLLTLFALFVTLTATAQVDTVIYYTDFKPFRVDTSIIWGNDTTTSDSNMVHQYYHYIQTTGDSFLYQPQFVIYDSSGTELLPNRDLMNNGWRSSGTVKRWYIDSAMAAQAPDSLINFYVLPNLKLIFGSDNVN